MSEIYRIRRHPERRFSVAGALLLWLLIVVLIGGGMYLAQQQQRDPQNEVRLAVDRLNEIRRQVGAVPFQYSPQLSQSAQKHADYLSLDGEDAHSEYNHANPYFSGTELGERTEAAGYFSETAENLVTTSYPLSGVRATEDLMTALYHRLSLLNPYDNEIGAGWAHRRYGAVVFNQGNIRHRQLCHDVLAGKIQAENEGRYRYFVYCKNQLQGIDSDQVPEELPTYIAYPVGHNIEPVYGGDETPNPMPGYTKTGNPLSISFHGDIDEIEVVSFKLFGPVGEVQPTHLMTSANDPNAMMEDSEFALFALKPLQFASDYRAEFRYKTDESEQIQTITWTFRTRPKRSWLE